MCKVLVIPKVSNETRSNALSFMEVMKPLLSTGNRDGLGYTAVRADGSMFGQRFHNNEDSVAKILDTDPGEELKDLAASSFDAGLKGLTNSFGRVDLSEMTALTMHTRYATSGKEFRNTHPFVYEDKDTSLIHNGIIDNTKDFTFKVSSCDSESILIAYLDKEVNLNLSNIQKMADSLKGYYACGVFSRDAAGARVLDVFKGPDAFLYATYVKELDSLVYCTSKDDIEKACGVLGFTHGVVHSLKEGVAMRFIEGKMVEKQMFNPPPRFQYSWKDWKSDNKKVNSDETKKPTVIGTKLTKGMSEYLHTIPNLTLVQ